HGHLFVLDAGNLLVRADRHFLHDRLLDHRGDRDLLDNGAMSRHLPALHLVRLFAAHALPTARLATCLASARIEALLIGPDPLVMGLPWHAILFAMRFRDGLGHALGRAARLADRLAYVLRAGLAHVLVGRAADVFHAGFAHLMANGLANLPALCFADRLAH